MGGCVSPVGISKQAYADRLGVSPSAVSKMIARHAIYPPALREDGKIDDEMADRQLRRVIGEVRRARERRAPVVRLPAKDRPPAPPARD
jgi:predicted transcriptional regulator